MKRFLAGLVVGIIIASAPLAIAESPIKLVVNGNEIAFPDAPPQILNNRTMVPARPLAEALGADVKWDESTRTVKVTSTQTATTQAVANTETVTTPVVIVPPETFTRDGVLYVSAGQVIRVLLRLYQVGQIRQSSNRLTIAGTEVVLPEVREYSRSYYAVYPIVNAGLATEDDFLH